MAQMIKKKKKILFVIMLRINSLNFSIYHTAVLATVIEYITSLVLVSLITGSLYLLSTFLQAS